MGPYSMAHPQYLFLPEYPPWGVGAGVLVFVMGNTNRNTGRPGFRDINSRDAYDTSLPLF